MSVDRNGRRDSSLVGTTRAAEPESSCVPFGTARLFLWCQHAGMSTAPNAESSAGTNPAGLTQVLEQTKHVKETVDEAAEELSSVNAAFKQGLVDRGSPPTIEQAIERNEIVEDNVRGASEELSSVNRGLEAEITNRRLATPVEKDKAARHAAFKDPLTGLPNRALLHDRLEHGLAQATRHGWSLVVMFLDLDDFKTINDSYGHAMGDSVLQMIAGRFKENIRGDDTIGRYGGDEFLCLLTEVRNETDSALIAEKIITAIQAPCHVSVDNVSISVRINASIGIATFPKDGTTADALIKSADTAMYQAKRDPRRRTPKTGN